jgi:hypothetical protein
VERPSKNFFGLLQIMVGQRGLQRTNSALDMYATGKAGPPRLTLQQRALLDRFGLRGEAAHNDPFIARYYAAERPGTNAYQAVQLARGIASGAFGTKRRAPARADPRLLGGIGDKRAYNQAIAAARARGNATQGMKAAWAARRRNQKAGAMAARVAAKAAAKIGRQKRQERGQRIRKNLAGGLRGFDPETALVSTLRAKTGGSKRARLKQAVSHLWAAAQASASILGKTVEQILQELITERGYDIVVQYASKTQKRFLQVAGGVSATAMSLATGFLTRSTCVGLLGGAALQWVVWPVAQAMSNKAYLAVEKNYTRFIDDVVSRTLRSRNLGKNAAALGEMATSNPLGMFIKMASRLKVPSCLVPQFVGTALRGFINSYARVLAGVELEFATMARVLLTHRQTIQRFLEGQRVALRDVVLDLVDAVPNATLDEVAVRIQTRLSSAVARPLVVPFNPSSRLADMIVP